jgi:WD40 repeat protein
VTSVASFPDGRLVSGGADGAVRMWKVSDRKTSRGTHQWEQQWQLPQCCPCSVRSLAVAGCKQLLVGGADGGVRVWFYEPQVRRQPFDSILEFEDYCLQSNLLALTNLRSLSDCSRSRATTGD